MPGNHSIQGNEPAYIKQLKQGSSKAFDKIYQMYARRLYAYSLQFTKSPEDSEEIVQDVFVKLWTNREHIRQEDTLRPLLFIMVKHHLISAFRAKINHPVYEDYINLKDGVSPDNASRNIDYKEFVATFRKLLRTLPDTQQKAIILSRMENLSNKEIAEKLTLSEQSVKNALSIGLKKLKAELVKIYFLFALLYVNISGFFSTT